MKRNISDLLDDYVDRSVTLNSAAPLSPARIKELTMNQITEYKQTSESTPTRRFRTPARLLIAAAAVAVLSASALAAGYVFKAGELLQNLFSQDDAPLTPGQVEMLDQIGRTFEGGVTSNGTTITPVAALADENIYYLRLRIEAPEGVVLPDLDGDTDGYYQIGYTLDLSAYDSECGYGSFLEALPDSDPTDNVKELVMQFSKQTGTPLAYNDGVSKPLTIQSLWIQSPEKEYTQILSGEFTFDIGLYFESKEIALDCDGLSWTSGVWGFTNYPERIVLTPLGLAYRFQTNVNNYNVVCPGLGDFKIVMKDGSVFLEEAESLTPRQMDPRFDPASDISDTPVNTIEEYVPFDTPLDLTQVDYVQYGDHKLPVALD